MRYITVYICVTYQLHFVEEKRPPVFDNSEILVVDVQVTSGIPEGGVVILRAGELQVVDCLVTGGQAVETIQGRSCREASGSFWWLEES